MNVLRVSITTPYGNIFDGDVDYVSLPGTEGEFGVLSGHSDVLTMLKAGVIEIKHKGQDNSELIAINWGYAKVQAGMVDILIDSAVVVDKSSSHIAKVLQDAKKLLEDASNDKVALSSVFSKIDFAAKG